MDHLSGDNAAFESAELTARLNRLQKSTKFGNRCALVSAWEPATSASSENVLITIEISKVRPFSRR